MGNPLFEVATESVCPECLRTLPARICESDGQVVMDKSCPVHGRFKSLIWSDAEMYWQWRDRGEHAASSLDAVVDAGPCPRSCGLCRNHEGDTCTAIFHLTQRCNLSCPVCFAAANEHGLHQDLAMEQVEVMYRACMSKTCIPTVQLSGGEPTLLDELPDMVALGKNMGIRHIQVNTNGIRLASDPAFLARLSDAGCDLVYLQFDACDDEVFNRLRGRPLLDVKRKVIENCAKLDLGVLLVVTVHAGINEDSLGDIVYFAKSHMPTVKGIHFQPATMSGRSIGGNPCTFPDILHAVEEQTNGEVHRDAVVPRHKASGVCSFSSTYFLDGSGRLRALTGEAKTREVEHEKVDGFVVEAVDYADKFWRASRKSGCCDGGKAEEDPVAIAMRKRTLAISGMHFMDAWNFDLERLRGCCVHVMTPQGLSIPFCSYYLTARDGTRMYGPNGLMPAFNADLSRGECR